MCMDKKNEFGKTVFFFGDEKVSEVVKKSAVLLIMLPYVYHLYKKMYKYCNWSKFMNYNLTI